MMLDPSRRTRVVIQSRLNSSRLPGKALLHLAGYPLVELVARRAGRSGHEVVVATSEEDYDGLIARTVESAGIPVFRGSLDDVLGRFVQACRDLHDEDVVVRLTGDNPLVDAELVDELLAATAASGHRYGRIDIDAVPEGLGVEVFTAGDLRDADEAATSEYDREHVTPWLRRELGEYLHVPKGSPAEIRAYRATVDTLNDFVRVSAVFAGEADPVGAGWHELLSRLPVPLPRHLPPTSEARDGDLASLVLEVSEPATGPAAPHERARRAADLRELLRGAVDHGVSDVVVDARRTAVTGAIRREAFPALAGRLSFIVRVGPPDTSPDCAGIGVEAAVERSLALLAQRRCRALLADFPVTDQTWAVLRRYVDEGVADLVGCTVAAPEQLARALTLPGIEIVELDARCWEDGPDVRALLDEWSRRGHTVLARVDSGGQGSGVAAEAWCGGIVATAPDTGGLREILLALGADPPARPLA